MRLALPEETAILGKGIGVRVGVAVAAGVAVIVEVGVASRRGKFAMSQPMVSNKMSNREKMEPIHPRLTSKEFRQNIVSSSHLID
jgi:hypothetical protein